MPTSFVALIVLLFSAAPGYVYVRIVEVRLPRRRRSPLLELVDLVCVGTMSSAGGALTALLLAPHWTALLPLEGLLTGTSYLSRHPWQAMSSGALTLAVGVICAATGGLVIARHRGTATRHTPYSPMRRAVELTAPGHSLWLAVQLTDGRLWEGKLLSLDGEHELLSEGDLVLQWPLAVTQTGKGRLHHPARFVVIPGSQIVVVYGTDLAPPPTSPTPQAVTQTATVGTPSVLPTPDRAAHRQSS
ncbi:DUF6338 family protein [Streptomyces sp. NPDC057474]|uniref:DUF6338 family protein n=1 Tax=Streptomyces sp. NPDC057474 TaxID=3346144 RepID=UPI00367D2F70